VKLLKQLAGWTALSALVVGCAGPSTPEPNPETAEIVAGPVDSAPEPIAVIPLREGPRPTQAELTALRLSADQAPGDKRARRRLAIALFEAGQTDESLAMFEEDVRASPGAASLLNLGRAYDRVLRYPDAEATFQKVLQLSPGHPTALHAMGNIALKRGDREEAIALYRGAIASKPDYLMAYAHLADALKQGGETQAAYETYTRVLQLKPANANAEALYQDAVYNVAAIELANGDPERAAEVLEQLLKVRPDHASAHYAYGQALMMLGREDEAQRAFDIHMQLQERLAAKSPAAMGD
jgi:tetratricopeptide (TPR) repeat protein